MTWLPAALERLASDPLARLIPAETRSAMAQSAREAGLAMAREARRSPRLTAAAALSAHGVALRESADEPAAGPFIHHALYTAPPPRVTLFVRALTAVERVLAATAEPTLPVREVVLAHELFHHLVRVSGAPEAVRPRVPVVRLGRWCRWGVVRAAEEIAAGGFAAAWCGVDDAPDRLDRLTRLAYGIRSAPGLGACGAATGVTVLPAGSVMTETSRPCAKAGAAGDEASRD